MATLSRRIVRPTRLPFDTSDDMAGILHTVDHRAARERAVEVHRRGAVVGRSRSVTDTATDTATDIAASSEPPLRRSVDRTGARP